MKPWEERFLKEYAELLNRTGKLARMLHNWKEGTLDFTPKCPFELLDEQLGVMCKYLDILEQRAKIEGIRLQTENPS